MSKVLGKEVMLSMDTIAQVTGCIRKGSTTRKVGRKHEIHILKAFMGKTSRKQMGRRRYDITFCVKLPKYGPTSLKRV